jgi:hypothetical protein
MSVSQRKPTCFASLRKLSVVAVQRLRGKDAGPFDLEEWEVEVASLATVHSFRIDWDQKVERFVGTVPGVESLAIDGTYPSVVMTELVRAAWLLKAIEVLDEVLERRA